MLMRFTRKIIVGDYERKTIRGYHVLPHDKD